MMENTFINILDTAAAFLGNFNLTIVLSVAAGILLAKFIAGVGNLIMEAIAPPTYHLR